MSSNDGHPVPMDAVFGFTGEYEVTRQEDLESRVERRDELIFEVRAPAIALSNIPKRISTDELWERFRRIDLFTNIGWIIRCYARLTFIGLGYPEQMIHPIVNANLWAIDDGSFALMFHRAFAIVPDFDGGDPLTYAPIGVYVRCVEDYFDEAVTYGTNLGYMRHREGGRPGSVAWICRLADMPSSTSVLDVMEIVRLHVLSVEEMYASRLLVTDTLKPQRAVARLRLGRSLSRIEKERLKASYGIEIADRLGSGGMGEVYQAIDRNGERVAVKVLAPDVRFDVTQVSTELFGRETAALRTLSGLGIAPELVGRGDVLGRAFYVQEFLPWPNLRQWSASARSLADKLAVIKALREVIDRMHGRGVVHRDISPRNILVAPDARDVRLIDFGTAIGTELPTYAHDAEIAVGSLRYSAPEIRDSPSSASPASDVFSVGVIVYELLLDRQVAGNLPELVNLLPNVPAELSEYAQRAVSLMPENRPR